MIRGYKLSVVIPCHDEREGLTEILNNVPQEVDEVVVVDNNSTDGSGDVARNHGARVVFEPRKGYGQAYKAGLTRVDGDIIGTMDGDGSYHMDDVVKLAGYLLDQEVDFITGSRFPLRDMSSMHFKNYVGNKILTLAMGLLFRLKLSDSQSGMWVFRREALGKIMPASDGMPFSEEIKLDAFLNPHLKCAELPIGYLTRVGKVKLHAWRDGLKNLSFLIRRRVRGKCNPS